MKDGTLMRETNMGELAFNLDYDYTLGITELDACRYGVVPCMRKFQLEVCGKPLGEDQLYCWQTGRLISVDQFCGTTAGTTMNTMLRCAAEALGKRNLPDSVFVQYCTTEQLLCCDRFAQVCEPMPFAAEYMQAIAPYGFVNITSSSVLYRLWVCLQKTKLLKHVFQVVSGEGDGYWRRPKEQIGDPDVVELWPVPNGEWQNRFHSLKAHHPHAEGKPGPDIHFLAAHMSRRNSGDEGVAIKNTLVLDDGTGGVESGARAGAFVIGFIPPFTPKAEQQHRATILRDRGAHEIAIGLEQALDLSIKWAKSRRPDMFVKAASA